MIPHDWDSLLPGEVRFEDEFACCFPAAALLTNLPR
jgi:hypothetical protein